MESPGGYWTPGDHRRQGLLALLVVNAQQIKAVLGRNTAGKDAEWSADLGPQGLVRGSVIPPAPPRARRALTRPRRTLVAARARLVNRRQQVLEAAHLTLAAGARAIVGVAARALGQGLLDGDTAVQAVAEWARGRMRTNRAVREHALVGRMRPPHALLRTAHRRPGESLDASSARFTAERPERLPERVAAFSE